MEKSKTTSIASLSADLAWRLLTPEEQQLLLAYLAKVRNRNLGQETHKEQEERQLVLVTG